MSEGICARFENMPPHIRGYSYLDNDGNGHIVLNARLTAEQNRKTYLHEMKHIDAGENADPDYIEYPEELT